METDYENIIVIHTFVVHPKFMKAGVGSALMNFARSHSVMTRMKTIRLDVSIDNIPAIALYEKQGYQYVGTVDLGLNYPHLKWFKLYELIL
ncbi:GNAT family N-acetyltransferase [Dysgonomonas sp. OttesenSCG-928-M03]|nr:GNAT family N-acetyltransferase [Dysgonomonas sp. OttesenSCG-928-M03]